MSATRPSPITEEDRAVFLAALRQGRMVTAAAAMTGHSRQAFYRLRDTDDLFRRAWAQSWTEGSEVIAEEVRRRAVDGFDEVTVDADGKVLRTVHRYSDALLHRLAAARLPEMFGERAHVDLDVRRVDDGAEVRNRLAARLREISERSGIAGALSDGEPGNGGGL